MSPVFYLILISILFVFGTCFNSEPYRTKLMEGPQNLYVLPFLILTYTPTNLLLLSTVTAKLAGEKAKLGVLLFLVALGLGSFFNAEAFFKATQADYMKLASLIVYAALGPELVSQLKQRFTNAPNSNQQ